MTEGYEQLSDIDMLEADPRNRTEALRNPRLRPFWIDLENKEIRGLWDKGCFKKWKCSELKDNDRVFGSLYHYHIKRDGSTGQVTNCK
eukprot:3481416-Rhodomonas_salina.1